MKTPTQARIIRATILRGRDLLALPNWALKEALFDLAIRSDGMREELIERLHREIWKNKYDGAPQ
jgi:hypothetical protein